MTATKRKPRRKRAAGESRWLSRLARSYDIAGKTSDGVVILRAKVKPKHFTSRQIRSAIREVQTEAWVHSDAQGQS